MIPVSDILKRAKALLGNCKDEEVYATLTEAVRILGNKGDFDPLMGVVDIAVTGRVVALPHDVQTVMAVNIDGITTVGRDQYFNFHLNGPGDNAATVGWEWQDNGMRPLFSDPKVPEEFYAYALQSSDVGKVLRIYGYDGAGDWVRTADGAGGTFVDGAPVPVQFAGDIDYTATRQLFSRVSRVSKPITNGAVVLSSYDRVAVTAITRGVYQYDETEPLFRRIILAIDAKVCRVAYRKKNFKLTKPTDLIPLYSESPVLTMVQSIRALREERYGDAAMSEAIALRHLSEEHENRQPPVKFPLQFNTAGTVVSGDQLD